MSYVSIRSNVANWLLILGIALFSGCAAVTNPIANGIPARLVPDELLGESQEALEQIPLDWLRVDPPKPYTLDTGDILGVYVEGALGDRDSVPPINFPQVAEIPPSFGYPMPVGEDGYVPLPLVKDNKVDVKGLSIAEAQQKIIDAYTGKDGGKNIFTDEQVRVVVTLVRPRLARILIIREDAPGQRPSLNDPNFRLFGSSPSLGTRLQGMGQIEEIPEVEADLMTALARSGGLPGPTAQSEVVIYRSANDDKSPDDLDKWDRVPPALGDGAPGEVIRIPLRIPKGAAKPFSAEDVVLYSGDIVFVPPRDTDVYYTGGLLPAREVPLPRDNDIRVVEAILRAGGGIVNGGLSVGTFASIASLASGIDNSSPSLVSVLRKTPNGRQVMIRVDLNRALRDPRENLLVLPDDVLVLQETPSEAVSRYIAGVFNFNVVGQVFSRGSAAASGQLVVP